MSDLKKLVSSYTGGGAKPPLSEGKSSKIAFRDWVKQYREVPLGAELDKNVGRSRLTWKDLLAHAFDAGYTARKHENAQPTNEAYVVAPENRPRTGPKKLAQGLRSALELMWDKLDLPEKPSISSLKNTHLYAEFMVEVGDERYEVKITRK